MLDPIQEEIRQQFPVLKHWIYFNHAATGPLPTSAVKAIERFCQKASIQGEVPYLEAERVVERTRKLAARLMMVKPAEIAFVKNTSQGIIIALGSIPWERGDNIVIMKDAFPANSYPYHLLLPEVEKRFISSVELAGGPECVFRLVDEHTRAVALDWVHFLSGARFDINAIGQFCQKRRIYFIVDAIQGLGAVAHNFSLSGADFVVAGGGKWLLAPQGVGLLYVNAKRWQRLKPFNLGWFSCEWREFNDCFTPKPLKRSAARFEEGTKNYIGIYALEEALKLLLGFGMENVNARINKLTSMLQEGLMAMGFEILTPREEERRAGIVTCRREGSDMKDLRERLVERATVVSVRENWLRISPHFYNTEEDVERFLNNVRLLG